jgi:hypothetical protein
MSHIDIPDDHVDMVNAHIDIPYPISHIKYSISIPIFHIDSHIDIPLMSDIPVRFPTSISDHILSLWTRWAAANWRPMLKALEFSA